MVLNKKSNDLEATGEETELDKVCELLLCFKRGAIDLFELITSVYNNCETS